MSRADIMGQPVYSWGWAVCDFYKPLEDVTGWDRCPNCGEHPRTWVFDNGNFAKCKCLGKYEGGTSAESILSACYKRKIPYTEWEAFLRIAWNQRCAIPVDSTPRRIQ